ncbi:uncharacterized protein EDB91DRAFT_1238450 [Suillus paluster]|uniref:uncharacterized protein n=1 Tax=Suillus paluster TaxID=48578 RepID=UPI001B8674EC|nr:uncharacterized protein EDB91DRAFT_1238450 [Suillus paluster]KAG1734250.1 hypothetical protein EDB91DRAFT_1238450 [Suillus paluster]
MSEEQQSCNQHHQQVDAFNLVPGKGHESATDLLVHYECHFRRTIHALCNFQALLTNGILWMGELAEIPDENFTAEEQHEHRIFQELLKSVAGLEERLMQGGDDEVDLIAELITPKGQSLVPPLTHNVKLGHSFHHERTGVLLCLAGLDWSNLDGEMIVTGDQWPLFLYADYHYDLEDPWNGLFRSALLVCAYKHVFMSLNTVTNSEWFYNSILDIFEDPDEKQEVDDLVVWWNRQIFPSYSTAQCPLVKNSALAIIRERHARMKESGSVSGAAA